MKKGQTVNNPNRSSVRRSNRVICRIWWATLPYWGWIGWGDDWDDEANGTVPAPWYAYPLAWIHNACQWWIYDVRKGSVWE